MMREFLTNLATDIIMLAVSIGFSIGIAMLLAGLA